MIEEKLDCEGHKMFLSKKRHKNEDKNTNQETITSSNETWLFVYLIDIKSLELFSCELIRVGEGRWTVNYNGTQSLKRALSFDGF